MLDLFGIRKRHKKAKERRHNEFMQTLTSKSDECLLGYWQGLDMDYQLDNTDEYSDVELRAVENELSKRGYTDEYGHVYPFKFNEKIEITPNNKLTLLDVFKQPKGAMFKCSLGVRVKLDNDSDKCMYYKGGAGNWKLCPLDSNYANATYELIEE